MTSPKRCAGTHDEIKPLVELCKTGKLFDVQEWIAANKPLDPPAHTGGTRRKSPLEYGIEQGFHSLVQVLLEGGASFAANGTYCPMNHALEKRRFDIVQLLVGNGFDPKQVDMHDVFASWDPEIMEYFIDRGANIESGNSLAWALCQRIRTALRILQKYRERFPSFQEQANIALRCHCKEGNLKWVSLMLWAGADPMRAGPDDPDEEQDGDDEGITALELAALYEHFDVFAQKQIKIDPSQPRWNGVVRYLTSGQGVEILRQLLEKGLDPNDQKNGGCSTIQSILVQLDWSVRISRWRYDFDDRLGDDHKSRENVKAIHLLAKYGGLWRPEERRQINVARQSLLKMSPDYTVEFV